MNGREFLKEAGVVLLAAVFLLGGSPTQAADPQPVTVLVVYHSASGKTEKMAHGVAEGGKGCLRYERRSKAGGRGSSR
ncbi:MAG TPA: hypothetical protein VGK65_19245 [Candidatus Binatia bacterium]|jgi:hypothetical protein